MSTLLNTYTVIDIVDDLITIMSYYLEDEDLNTISAFISDSVQSVDLVSFIEGELGIRMRNYPEEIDYEIDGNGNLVVFADDADNYSVNDDGYLIYTFPPESGGGSEDEGTFLPLPSPSQSSVSTLLSVSISGINATTNKYLNGNN